MSRTVIVAVVAVVISALAGIALFVTSSGFAARASKDAELLVERARVVAHRLGQLHSIDVQNKADRLAARPEFAAALKATGDDRKRQALIGFQWFLQGDKEGPVKPDIIGLVDVNAELVALSAQGVEASVVGRQWKDAKGESLLPALDVVLGQRKVIISDIWEQTELMKVGVAPVIDPEAPIDPNDPDRVEIIGAVVVGYAQTSRSAQADAALLGTEIAYFNHKRVRASSFTRGGAEEDTARSRALSALLEGDRLAGGMQQVSIDGAAYWAAVVPAVRSTTKPLPPECGGEAARPACYPPMTAGAVVAAPITALAIGNTVKLFLVLVGVGALAIALLGLYVTHRRLIAQIDQVEQGVNDVINGNLERTFRPVGQELDGLSNGLNVMLARLLGRPEPGEEEFDDDGNPIVPGKVEFDDGEDAATVPAREPHSGELQDGIDPGLADLAALAREAEPDYYKRVYTEYAAARRAAGASAAHEVSFENFIAKLKVTEGKLKAQHQCRAVRFRVITADGKVLLKPVPIFS